MYLAAVMEKAGHQVEILDAFMGDDSIRRVGDTIEIGMPYGKISRELQRKKPDLLGIGNPFSTQIEHAKKVADLAKEVDSKLWTVVGGPHVSVMPTEFLEEAKSVDIAVMGEGEYTIIDIAKAFDGSMKLADVEGIAYRQDGKIKLNPRRPFIKDLDELPYPAYHLVDMERYLNVGKVKYRSLKPRSISMITSRGCPYNCCFCSVHLHMGKGFRAHSAGYVLDHLEYVVNKFKIKTVFFEDDNLTFDMKRMEEICDKIVERKIKFNWETPNGIRADRVNLELLKKMKRSGCKSVSFGVESGDQYVLDNIIRKDLKLEQVEAVAKMCKQIHLKSAAFYIIGFPGEKKENMCKTVDFALAMKRKYDLSMGLLVATPSYGTKLYEECLSKGYLNRDLTPRALAEVRQTEGTPLIETEDFTAEDVKEIAAEAMKEYKRISLVNVIKNPRATVGKLLRQPRIAAKFIKNLFS